MRNMTRTQVVFLTLAASLVAMPALAQNSLQVVQPGLNGTGNALEVTFDNAAGNQAVVISQHPTNETSFSMSLFIDPVSLDLCRGTTCRLFVARAFGNRNGGFLDAFRLGVRQFASGDFRVILWYKDSASVNPGTWEQLNGPFFNGGTNATKFSIEWQSESSDGAGDGIVRISKNDDAGTLVETTTSSNFNDIDNARIGHVSGSVRAGATGTALFDEYVSTRSVSP